MELSSVVSVLNGVGSLRIMDDGLSIILHSPTTSSGSRWTAEDTACPSDQVIQSRSVHSCYAAPQQTTPQIIADFTTESLKVLRGAPCISKDLSR